MSCSEPERRWILFGRLKKAVSKLRILLKFDLHVWRLAASLLTSSSPSSAPSRLISFGSEDRPGLAAVASEDYDPLLHDDSDIEWHSPPAEFITTSPPSASRSELRRSISRGMSMEDDIDKRAEMFISNFRRQLRIERQISLDLKYCQHKT
ncbi:hypothetical protein LINGRAHAP2_LOCUS30969 [Linum grandiflorum]